MIPIYNSYIPLYTKFVGTDFSSYSNLAFKSLNCYNVTMKICNACKDELDENLFSKNSSKKDGLHGSCKLCKSKHQRKWYEGASVEHKKNVQQRKQLRTQKCTQLLYEFLMQHPCKHCGETDPIVLEFDHLGNKEKGISVLLNMAYSWERMLKEIEKCQVLCANCHRRKTANEQNWRMLIIQRNTGVKLDSEQGVS